MKCIFLSGLMTISIASWAQSDCAQPAQKASSRCDSGVTAAQNSSVSNGGSGGVNGDGTGFAGAAVHVMRAVGQAKAGCKEDLKTCERECSKALQAAASNPGLQSRIKKNMQKCVDDIEASQARADSAIGQMGSVAEQSTTTSECASAGECVHKAGMTNLGAASTATQRYGPGSYGSGTNEGIWRRPDGSVLRIPTGPGDAMKAFGGKL